MARDNETEHTSTGYRPSHTKGRAAGNGKTTRASVDATATTAQSAQGAQIAGSSASVGRAAAGTRNPRAASAQKTSAQRTSAQRTSTPRQTSPAGASKPSDTAWYSRYANGSGPSPRSANGASSPHAANRASANANGAANGNDGKVLADSRDFAKKPKRKRHRGLKIALVVIVALVVAVGVCGYFLYDSVKIVKAEASTLQDAIDAYSDDIRAGENDAATQDAQTIANSSKIMHEETSGFLWTAASWFPGIGTDVTNVRVLSEVMDELSQSALIPITAELASFSLGDLMVDGGINATALIDLLGLVGKYSPSLSDASTQISALEQGTMEEVNSVLDKIQPLFSEFDAVMSEADRIAAVAPDLLGADGEAAVYLIVAMNNVEIRAIGGFPGSWGTLTVDNGTLMLGDFESFATTGGKVWTGVAAKDGEEMVIGAAEFPNPQYAAMIPDFPRAAEVLASFWQEATGDQITGVIGVDPIFVQYLLELTGSITTSAGTTLDGTNAAKSIMHDTYLTLDSSYQDTYFAEVAGLTFSQLVNNIGDVPPLTLLRMMEKSTQEGHFEIWFPNAEEQELATKYGASGAVSTDPTTPVLGVYYNDFTWSKIDYYLNPAISYEKIADNADGSASYYVTLTLTNMLNTEQGDWTSELTRYIYGYNSEKNNAADMLTTVILMAPKGGTITDVGTDAELEGDKTEISLYYNDTWILHTHTAGASTSTITFTVTTSPEATSELSVDMTPTAKDIAGWQ